MKSLITLLFLPTLLIQTLNAQDASLFSYERKTAFNENTVYKNQRPSGLTTLKIVIDGTEARVPFYYYQNTGEKAKHLILLLHGLGGSKEDFIFGGSEYQDKLVRLKDTLLNLGYSLAIPDAAYHGERSYELDFRPAYTLVPMPGKPTADVWAFERGNAVSIADYLHIMDFLETMHPEMTFSAIGYSMGGNSSLILNGLDKRLNKVIACAPPLNRPAADTTGTDWPEPLATALKNVTPMEYGKSQAAPVLLLLGKQDPFYTEEEVLRFSSLPRDVAVSHQYFDAGHDLPEGYIKKAVSWLMEQNDNRR